MLYLKDGKDVHGNKIELLILDDKIDKISEGFSEEEIKNIEKNEKLEIIDLKGKTVMPGVIELVQKQVLQHFMICQTLFRQLRHWKR